MQDMHLLKQFIEAGEDAIVDAFASLPHARRLPVPGLPDAVLVPPDPGVEHPVCLVAHTDTVWPGPGRLAWCGDGRGRSAVPDRGIGADDRAGCAALWRLRDSGAGLLIVPAEEDGCVGSRHVARYHRDILEDQVFGMFMQFDRRGVNDLVYYDANPADLDHDLTSGPFNGYAEAVGSFSDVSVLAPALGVVGVNVSIGFDAEHTPQESIDPLVWAMTVRNAAAWLRETRTRGGIRYVYRDARRNAGHWYDSYDDDATGWSPPDEPEAYYWCDDCALPLDEDETDTDRSTGVPICPVCGGPLVLEYYEPAAPAAG
jgi:hypothetical protein